MIANLASGSEYRYVDLFEYTKVVHHDSPFLRVSCVHNGRIYTVPIQTSHLTEVEQIEIFAGTNWRYITTTYEDIVVCDAVEDLGDLITVTDNIVDDIEFQEPLIYPTKYLERVI